MEQKGADSWTQAQVDRLSGHGIDELLDLWARVIDPVTTMLARAPKDPHASWSSTLSPMSTTFAAL